jgi:hypothetical protein
VDPDGAPVKHRPRLLATLAATAVAVGGPVVGNQAVAAAAAGGLSVGAAVADFTPYCGPDGNTAATAQNCQTAPPGFVDPANCVAPPGFTGRRLFAFEEPYQDQKGSGHYDLGDPFVDCNRDGRWDGNFIGGGSNAPRFYDHVADPDHRGGGP